MPQILPVAAELRAAAEPSRARVEVAAARAAAAAVKTVVRPGFVAVGAAGWRGSEMEVAVAVRAAALDL